MQRARESWGSKVLPPPARGDREGPPEVVLFDLNLEEGVGVLTIAGGGHILDTAKNVCKGSRGPSELESSYL